MAIQIGDAVLRVAIDLQDLSAFEARMNALPSKLRTSGDAAANLSTSLNSAGANASRAAVAGKEVATSFEFAGKTLSTAGKQAQVAGLQMAEGAALARKEMAEARGEAALLGEATGIRLPRHVRTFLSSIDGVGGILSAAFSATAVYFLAEALIQGTEKMSKWVAETFIFTQAQRTVNAVLLDSNKALNEYNEKLKELQKQFVLIGQSGASKTLQEGIFKAEDARKAALTLNDISNEVHALRNGLVSVEEAARNANNQIRALHPGVSDEELKKLNLLLTGPIGLDAPKVISAFEGIQTELKKRQETFYQDLANIDKQASIDQERSDQAAAEARIHVAKTTGDAITAIELQQALIRNASLKVSYLEDAIAKKQSEDAKYQTSLTAFRAEQALNTQREQEEISRLQTARILFEQHPGENAVNIQATDEQILAVQREYAAKRIEIDGQIVEAEGQHRAQELAADALFLQRRRDLLLRAQQEIKQILIGIGVLDNPDQNVLPRVPDQVISSYRQATEQLERLLKAYQVLRIDGSAALTKQLADEHTAVEEVTKARDVNQATTRDVLLAQRAELETASALHRQQLEEIDTEIRLAEARGHNVTALKEMRAATEAQVKADDEHARALDAVLGRLPNFLTLLQRGDALERIFAKDLASSSVAMKNFGATAQFVATTFGQAWASAFSQWILGESSLGIALRRGTAQVAAELAGRALLYGLFYTAQGIADVFWNPPRAGADFAAAGEFFALAAIAGGIARGINPGAASTGTSGTGQPIDNTVPANRPEQQPVQVVNVQHLAGGALVSRQTLAIVGDSRRGGNAREGVLPLDDPRAMDAIAGEIADRIEARGGTTNNNFTIQGLISGDDLNTIVRKITRQINTGRVRLTSSNSLRVTKRG